MTGASSFTGSWFASALIERNVSLIATASRSLDDYSGSEHECLARLSKSALVAYGTPFGSDAFLDLIKGHAPIDLFCFHGALATGHRSEGFDTLNAVRSNCWRLAEVMTALEEAGCASLLATGSIFEADEGIGEQPLRAFSPYGLSKTLTWQWVRYEAERRGFRLGKFVIAHPFGTGEKPGLMHYLIDQWSRGLVAEIKRPGLIRDFVHVDQLAAAYARMATELPRAHGTLHWGPSGYVETVGEFVARTADEFENRLRTRCRFAISRSPNASSEPVTRYNPHPLPKLVPSWPLRQSWDDYVELNAPKFAICA